MGNSGIDFDIDFYFEFFGVSIHPIMILVLLVSTLLILFAIEFKMKDRSSKDDTEDTEDIEFLKNTISDLNSITTKLNSEISELNSIINSKNKEIEELKILDRLK